MNKHRFTSLAINSSCPPSLLLENATVYRQRTLEVMDIGIAKGHIVELTPPHRATRTYNHRIDATGLHVFPGFIDIHVHFREPGFEQKETIATGSNAAAHGGYTAVCPMPNLNPVPDSLEHLQIQRERIRDTSRMHILPYGSISLAERGEALSDFQTLAPYVCAFTDDGVGVASRELMKEAMQQAKQRNMCIVAHAEEIERVQGGVIHDGEYAKEHGLPGNPSDSEWKQVERDLSLVRETGASYHVCHVSTKESVALLRQAKREGWDVSGETAPHYLVLHDGLLQDDGRFRMNPPIRSKEDQEALLEGLLDGTISCIATDHAPHTEEEKSKGLRNSCNGIVGLETAFPILYTKLIRTGRVPLDVVLEALTTNPRTRLSLRRVQQANDLLPLAEGIEVGEPADITVFDLNAHYEIQKDFFDSMGTSSPFLGEYVYGECLLTLVSGVPTYVAQ